MSLDVSLKRKVIFSYDDGKTFETELETVYTSNITHNLGKMAAAAGIYEALWRPYRLAIGYDSEFFNEQEDEFEENSIVKAGDIIPYLEDGLIKLTENPEYYKKYNSPNGWGMYEHFVPFVNEYLQACRENPELIVKVSR